MSEKDKKNRKRKKHKKAGAEQANDPTVFEKYFPVIENLILFVLNSTKWWDSFRAYLKDEVNYRAGLLARSIAFFVCALVFLVGSVIFLIMGLYFLAREYIQDPVWAAFALFGGALCMAVLLLLLMVNSAGKISESKKRKIQPD